MATVLAIAACVVGIAEADGGYSLTARTALGVLVWWAVGVAVVLGVAPGLRHPRAAVAPWLALALFAAWTGFSIRWAASSEKAYNEFDRVLLYLGVFTLGAVLAVPSRLRVWRDGLALGIVSVGLLALVSRLFPGTLGGTEAASFLPALTLRLSYPVGYWNGLGFLLALGFPLLLTLAVDTAPALARATAVAAFPVLAVAIYLTSSRGAVAAAAAGLAVAVAALRQRATAVFALAVGGLASAAATLRVAHLDTVVNRPLDAGAAAEGRQAAAVVVLAALAAGIGWLTLARAAPHIARPPRALKVAFLASIAVTAVAAAWAVDLPGRFNEFRRPPTATAASDPIASHLLSSNGSGRWQLWRAAIDELHSSPLHGRGAGSFEAWWAEHGSLSMFVRDAHSLYLETLGELGVVGGLLLAAALLTALAVGARFAIAGDSAGVAAAGLLGTVVAFVVAAGVDWMWELTIVSVIAMLCLGLLAGAGGTSRAAGTPRIVRIFAITVGVVAIVAASLQLPPLLSEQRLEASRAAAARGHLQRAAAEARRARVLEPWAATPYVQLALIEEQAGDLRGANALLRAALSRDRSDWRIWLLAARVQTEAGQIARARRSLAQSHRLNPRFLAFQRQAP